jgi:molybdate transport system substrate-binding protein
MTRSTLSATTVALLVGLLVPACTGREADPAHRGATGAVVVSAAASLTDAFAEMEAAFEAATPGVDVVLNLGPSSGLREQILAGAPVDVFAPADLATMNQVEEAGGVMEDPRVFARNRLRIAVPAGNPGGVTGLEDFARDEMLIGLCADNVPCGQLGREALANAGVVAAADTHEPDVRALLTKVAAGELDAGITYATDILAAGRAVEGVAIPDGVNVATDYPIAVLTAAPNPEAAAAFVEFVHSDDGRVIMADHGFETP